MANAFQFDFTTFRANLRSLMDSRGLSINAAADKLGVSPSSLSRYLNGLRDPELSYVIQIAEYFGVSTDWLLGLTNDIRTRMPLEVYEVAHLYSISNPDDRAVVQAVLNKYRTEGK